MEATEKTDLGFEEAFSQECFISNTKGRKRFVIVLVTCVSVFHSCKHKHGLTLVFRDLIQ